MAIPSSVANRAVEIPAASWLACGDEPSVRDHPERHDHAVDRPHQADHRARACRRWPGRSCGAPSPWWRPRWPAPWPAARGAAPPGACAPPRPAPAPGTTGRRPAGDRPRCTSSAPAAPGPRGPGAGARPPTSGSGAPSRPPARSGRTTSPRSPPRSAPRRGPSRPGTTRGRRPAAPPAGPRRRRRRPGPASLGRGTARILGPGFLLCHGHGKETGAGPRQAEAPDRDRRPADGDDGNPAAATRHHALRTSPDRPPGPGPAAGLATQVPHGLRSSGATVPAAQLIRWDKPGQRKLE